MTICEDIKALRRQHGLTQVRLAKAAQVGHGHKDAATEVETIERMWASRPSGDGCATGECRLVHQGQRRAASRHLVTSKGPVDYENAGENRHHKPLRSEEEIVTMIRNIAEFRGEKILVTDRPSCPYCSSRRQVAGPVGIAITIEARGVDGSRPAGNPVEVWTCACPTLKRPLFFGVLLYEVTDLTGTGRGPVDLAADGGTPEQKGKLPEDMEFADKAARR